MDSDSSSDDDCRVIHAVSFVKCCFCYLEMFCKSFFSLLKITGVTYRKPGSKRSGKIVVSALHFPAKCTIPCIFVSQEKGKIDYICIQGILKGQSRLCVRSSIICFFLFFKRQQNCHIDSTRFPSGPHRRRRFVVYILKQYFRLSKKSFVLFEIWLAARRLIAILSLTGPPRDPKISFRSL